MSKIESLMKIKNIHLNSLKSDLSNLDTEIDNLKLEIDDNRKILEEYINDNALGLVERICKLKSQHRLVERRLENKQIEVDKIKNDIIVVKQEIRSLELLIEKRKLEKYKEQERLEQNEFDELNSID